jgi:hypothetical protein
MTPRKSEPKKLTPETIAALPIERVKVLRQNAARLERYDVVAGGRAFEMQAQLAKKAYETYISEITKLGPLVFAPWFLAAADSWGVLQRPLMTFHISKANEAGGHTPPLVKCSNQA